VITFTVMKLCELTSIIITVVAQISI
jgi:hypothetical protein